MCWGEDVLQEDVVQDDVVQEAVSWDTTPCKVTPAILHGGVSPDLGVQPQTVECRGGDVLQEDAVQEELVQEATPTPNTQHPTPPTPDPQNPHSALNAQHPTLNTQHSTHHQEGVECPWPGCGARVPRGVLARHVNASTQRHLQVRYHPDEYSS